MYRLKEVHVQGGNKWRRGWLL